MFEIECYRGTEIAEESVFRRRWRERPRRRSPASLVLCFHASRRVSYRARLPRVSSVYDRNGSRSPRLNSALHRESRRVFQCSPSQRSFPRNPGKGEREGESVVAARDLPPGNKNIKKCMGIDSRRSLRCRRTRVYLVRGRRDSIKIVYLGEPGDICTAGFAWLRVAMGSRTNRLDRLRTSRCRSELSGILEGNAWKFGTYLSLYHRVNEILNALVTFRAKKIESLSRVVHSVRTH